jgi:SNF2 family DNA or RNA helicase
VIGDEMGLGKSVQALAAAAMCGQGPMLVICPASLRLSWAEEIER